MVSVSKKVDIFFVLLSKAKLAETGIKKNVEAKLAALERFDRFVTNASMFLKKL